MLRIYVFAMAGVVATTAGVIALDQTMARADWDETAPMTKTLNDDSASLGNQLSSGRPRRDGGGKKTSAGTSTTTPGTPR